MSKVLLASTDYRVRLQAAMFMMNDARDQLAHLGNLYAAEEDDFIKVVLSDLIAGVTNHIASWQDYINAGCPYDPRAQVSPRTYAHLKAVQL